MADPRSISAEVSGWYREGTATSTLACLPTVVKTNPVVWVSANQSRPLMVIRDAEGMSPGGRSTPQRSVNAGVPHAATSGVPESISRRFWPVTCAGRSAVRAAQIVLTESDEGVVAGTATGREQPARSNALSPPRVPRTTCKREPTPVCTMMSLAIDQCRADKDVP